MTDQIVKEHVKGLAESVPNRSGNLSEVLERGDRQRRNRRMLLASMSAIVAVAVVGLGVLVASSGGGSDVANGSNITEIELVEGLVVPVEPVTVESEGALVYLGSLGPEPGFDTSALGTEMSLQRSDPSNLVVPPSSNPFEPNALRADTLVYLGDINGAQVALNRSDESGQLCVFLGNGTEITGGGSCQIPGGPITHTNADPPIGSWVVWSWVPEDAAAVQMTLADGSQYWQRPTSRTVFFNLEDGRDLGTPGLVAFDTQGEMILSVGQIGPREEPETEPVFGVATGVVLLFDDGIDGILAVDPDQRIGSRRVIDGQRAGDQPYRLTRVDDSLVVGWSQVYSVDIASVEATSLGSATIYVPGAESAQVWLVNYPGGRIGGIPEVWSSNVDGDQLAEPQRLPGQGFPAIGVVGGLALTSDDGVAIWDQSTGAVAQRLGSGVGWVSDSLGSKLAWCDGGCMEMHVTDLVTGDEAVAQTPELAPEFSDVGFTERNARFSPDGSVLAATVADQFVLIDTDSGELTVVGQLPDLGHSFSLGWSPDGSQLFASSYSYQQPTTWVVRYEVASGTYTVAELPFGGALGFVVVDQNEADAFLRDQDQDPEDCPQVNTQPSGRTGICGFGF